MSSDPSCGATIVGLSRHNSRSMALKLKKFQTCSWSVFAVSSALLLSACATPARMHTESQLNDVALGCGLALGELIQDESEKRLLLLVHDSPNAEQRVCVAQWARRNGLKAVFVNMQFPAG
jgi:hypothetical protein